MTTSAGLVGFYSGNALRAVLVTCGWIPLLVPAVPVPLKSTAKR